MRQGRLFCSACREPLSVKKSVLESHMKSSKHDKGKERLKLSSKRDIEIVKYFKEYDVKHHPSGETLPETTRLYRIKVLTSFLKAGVPLLKLDAFRDIFEENGCSLTDSSNLRKMIPFIHENEVQKLKQSIAGRNISVIFDGTTHVSEALVIVLRYVDDNWNIQQRVCRMMLLAKSLTGEALARQLLVALSTELSIRAELVLAFMHDRASVNSVAMQTVSVLYTKMVDLGCFSHTIDNVGDKIKTPILADFVKHWISLFSHSPKTR